MEIEVNKLFQIRTDNLVCVDENDLLEIHRKEDVEEKDFVCPNDALLLLLCAQPRRPFVSHELILEVICLSEVWNEFL